MTTAYHPQADGHSEMTNQVVEVLLCCMIANHDTSMASLDELLPDVQFAINASCDFTTEDTQFKILYGVHPRNGTNTHHLDTGHESAGQFYRDR